MEGDLFQYVAAGGDVAIWAVFAMLWRLERRITVLEIRASSN